MDDFDYKKYSLQKLEDWVCDAISSGGATPQEVYDKIVSAITEYQEHHKKGFDYTTELLSLLKGNRSVDFNIPVTSETVTCGASSSPDPCMPPWGHSDMEYLSQYSGSTVSSCDKDDSSPECKNAWNSFWEEKNYPEEYGLQYTDEEITAMCDAAEKKDKVVKWQLPVEMDPSGEYFVSFPDDLLEVANLKEGDQVEWVDQGDGSYLLKKVK